MGPVCELFISFLPEESKLTAEEIRLDLWESLEAGKIECLHCDVVIALESIMCEDKEEIEG